MRQAKMLWMRSFDLKTRLRLRSIAFGGVDYAVTVLILFGFAALGTIPYDVAFKLLGVALLFNLLFLSIVLFRLTQGFHDTSLIAVQILAACGINLLGLLLAPQIAYMFIVNLFVPLAYGSMHFSRQAYLRAWMLMSCALGGVLWAAGAKIDIALATNAERWLFWLLVTVAAGRFLEINAEMARVRSRVQDKSKLLAALSNKIADLASRDDLTGLWNRREFMRMVLEARKRAERQRSGLCIALMDIDHFKKVNEQFGVKVGDEVLLELAQVLEKSRRMTDTLARYGGEEFALLLPDVKPDAAAVALERMRSRIAQHDWKRIAPGLPAISISIGIAGWQADETDGQLLMRADDALLEAKNAGRNCARISS